MTNKIVQENSQTKYDSKKQTTQNTAKQNYPGSVASCHTRPGNEMSLFYNERSRALKSGNGIFIFILILQLRVGGLCQPLEIEN